MSGNTVYAEGHTLSLSDKEAARLLMLGLIVSRVCWTLTAGTTLQSLTDALADLHHESQS